MNVSAVLKYWIGDGPLDDANYVNERMGLWFGKDPTVDVHIQETFTPVIESGSWESWTEAPRAQLAAVILLDQFTRNAFRGTARMFAYDASARAIAARAIESGAHLSVHLVESAFFFLPFEHGETREDQAFAVARFREVLARAPEALRPVAESWLDFAIRHQRIIERFGRFPHRNAILGRASTPEERDFLAQPGSGF